MSSEAAGIARRAAAEIQRRGLHKGAFAGAAGTFDNCTLCMSGALNYAAGLTPDDEDWMYESDLGAVLLAAVEYRTGGVSIPGWNDAPDTTAEDVVALLNAVADDLDAQ